MKKKGRGREHIKEMMASLGNFETPNFETLGEIDASQNAQYENSGSGKMSRSPRFLSTIVIFYSYSQDQMRRNFNTCIQYDNLQILSFNFLVIECIVTEKRNFE